LAYSGADAPPKTPVLQRPFHGLSSRMPVLSHVGRSRSVAAPLHPSSRLPHARTRPRARMGSLRLLRFERRDRPRSMASTLSTYVGLATDGQDPKADKADTPLLFSGDAAIWQRRSFSSRTHRRFPVETEGKSHAQNVRWTFEHEAHEGNTHDQHHQVS